MWRSSYKIGAIPAPPPMQTMGRSDHSRKVNDP
jgi:hypothetical protein